MSIALIHCGLDRERALYLSPQGRQDQIRPSEEVFKHKERTRGSIARDQTYILPNGEEATLERERDTRTDDADDAAGCVYVWQKDGVRFEGEFYQGMDSGKGRFTWPSGSAYEGQFFNMCFHGFGIYTRAHGSTYSGNWVMNLKHGVGEQVYRNGDHYKGSWYQGKRAGYGTYTWNGGNSYTGGWKADSMSGKGKLTWSNGDSFEGYWADGKEHGYGVYTWFGNGSYVGTWSRGLKDGKGTYYPPGTEPCLHLIAPRFSLPAEPDSADEAPRKRRSSFGLWRTSSSEISKCGHGMYACKPSQNQAESLLRKAESLPTRPVGLEPKWSLGGAIEKLLGSESMAFMSLTIMEDDDDGMMQQKQQLDGKDAAALLPIVEREYAQGVLISEIVKDPSVSRRLNRRQRQRQAMRESKRAGETIIKGHRSYDLMLDLQLGMRYSVGKIGHLRRGLEAADFGPRARIWMNFPRQGSQFTPCHRSVDFRWKDYCPLVFRTLREMFKIDAADYMLKICGNDELRELSSPGKSGSIFFLSQDDRFLIKTLRRQELKVLLKMLPHYYAHVCKYENTLITKFFGLHRIKLAGGHKVRFVVMGNVFCSELRIHRRFDLKGSSLGRSTDKIEIDETTTLKDLDLDLTFHLEPSWRAALLKQIEDDCNFLVSEQIMDYSLLLGLHFRAPIYKNLDGGKEAEEGGGSTTPNIDGTYPESLVLVAHEPNDRAQGSHIRGSSLRAAIAGDEQVDLLAGTTRLQIQLGANMPARAERKLKKEEEEEEAAAAASMESFDVVLCLGIIDILQEYNVSKKLEHTLKSIRFDSISISAIDPLPYSRRFMEFLQKIFPENRVVAEKSPLPSPSPSPSPSP